MAAHFLDELPAECEQLRDYQRQQLEHIREAIRNGARRVLTHGPTGAGKTHIISAATLAAERAGLRVLLLATRTRLIRQIHERLLAFKVEHGVIAAQLPNLSQLSRAVQLASVDTLYRRALIDEKMPLPGADLVVFDEAHLATADTRRQILESYPQATLLGFTATPARRSGRPLRDQFDVLLLGPAMRELIDRGVLVRARIFNRPVIEKRELKAVERDPSGDYATGSLSNAMSGPKLIGDVVSNWLRIASGRRTLLFAIDKRHGEALTQEFLRAGVAAEMITDADDEEVREAVLARLEAGHTKVVVNCFLLSYGVDLPSVEAIVLARPTRSVVLYLQAIGRGMRAAEGKEHVIVIDHGHVVESLGLPTSDFGWSLDEDSNVNRSAERKHGDRAYAEERARTCPECSHLWLVSEEGNSCVCCGWEPKPNARPIRAVRADLHELGTTTIERGPHDPEVAAFFCEVLGWYVRRWPDRWAAKPNSGRAYAWYAAAERFEISEEVRIPSRFWALSPSAACEETAGWLKYRLIRFAKSRTAA